MKLKIIGTVLAVVIFSSALQFSLRYSDLWINLTSSMPQGVYKVRALEEKRGAAVLFCLDTKSAKFAKQRGYVGYGNCPENTAPLGKYLRGLPGDLAYIGKEGIRINGLLIADSAPRLKDGNGRPLTAAKLDRALDQDEFILASERTQSYDSRYFGTVKKSELLNGLEAFYLF